MLGTHRDIVLFCSCCAVSSVGARPREPMRDLRHAVPEHAKQHHRATQQNQPNAFLRFLGSHTPRPNQLAAQARMPVLPKSKDHKMKTLSASVAIALAAILILAAPAHAQHTATIT